MSIQRLRFDDSTRVLRGGEVVRGHGRLLRLTPAGARLVAGWREGAPVGDAPAERRLADRLVDADLAQPVYPASRFTRADVAVVIPVRDRAEQLAVCLGRLGPVAEVVVVDDASIDSVAVGDVAPRVRLVRLDRLSGPAAARNAGLAATQAPLVAFVDSDALPHDGWLEPLLAHFSDDRVGAVAPRIRVPPGRAAVDAYERARSPLDMGARAGIVGPRRRVRFVPATALVVRRDALGEGFDESLRFGEDVDLVWRLAANGWRVRYEPAVCVEHPRRHGIRAWLRQRVEYGSSAAPLAERHPGALPHLVVPVAPAAIPREMVPLVAATQLRAARQLLDAAWRAYPPLALAAVARSRRARRLAAASLIISTTADWLERRPRLDPLRFGALRLADDLAYATGVWAGCLRAREAGPLIPRVVSAPNQKFACIRGAPGGARRRPRTSL